jgi:D-alanyl-D-alanine carboxypeptidase
MKAVLFGIFCFGWASVLWGQPTGGWKVAPFKRAELEKAFIRCIEKGEVPGGAVSVWAGAGLEWAQPLGYADVLTEKRWEMRTLTRIGSATMLFTAVGLLTYGQDGVLRMEDPIRNWLPDSLVDSLPNGRQITLRHLLTHTSGLPDYLNHPDLWDRIDAHPTRNWTAQEALRYAFHNRQNPQHRPGERWSFSHTNYVLLGLVLEKLSGKRWGEAIRQRVLRPAELYHTFAENHDLYDTLRLAHGYADADTNGLHEDYFYINQVQGLGDCGLISNSDDLVRFMRALFVDKLLLTDPWLDVLLTATETGDGSRFGHGVTLVDTPWGLMAACSGGLYGYTAGMFCLPKSGLTFAIVLNASDGDVEYEFDKLVGNLLRLLFTK